MAEYVPTKFYKGSDVRTAETWGEHYQLLWQGFNPDGPAPTPVAAVPPHVRDYVDDAVADLESGLSATFVSQADGLPLNTDDPVVAYRFDNDAATPAAKRVLQIRQNHDDYSLKIDHHGAGDAVNIVGHSTTDQTYTVLGIAGYNADLSTVKVTNHAAQFGGAVIAAIGSHAGRTASIINAENYGSGSSIVAITKPGGTGAGFKASFEAGNTYTNVGLWIEGRHTGGSLAYMENDTQQTSGTTLSLRQGHAGTTASLLALSHAGTGFLIDASADGFAVDGSGQVRTTQIFNIASFNNSKIVVGTTGSQIARNVADGGVVLQVKQDSAAGTGDLLNVQTSGATVRSRFNKAGIFMTRVNAAPADGDLGVGEVAFWFDSTSGAAKLMLKAKDAGGTVRTAQVALA